MACPTAQAYAARFAIAARHCRHLLRLIASAMARNGQLEGLYPPGTASVPTLAVNEFMVWAQEEAIQTLLAGLEFTYTNTQRLLAYAELWESYCRATLAVEFRYWVELAIEEGSLW